ncbi:MAG: single-stranded DNA-binding protein [Pseudomonadota bacterium]
MITISGPARLGENPILKPIGQGEDQKFVCTVSVKLLNDKPKKDTEDWVDKGVWVELSVWGRDAESAAKFLVKGDKININGGDLTEDSWPDKDDASKTHRKLKVNTNSISPFMSDLDSLKYKERTSGAASEDGVKRTGTDG